MAIGVAGEFIAFLVEVFEGVERGDRELRSDGAIDDADVLIGDSLIMISEASEKYRARRCVNFVYVAMLMPRTGWLSMLGLARSWLLRSGRAIVWRGV